MKKLLFLIVVPAVFATVAVSANGSGDDSADDEVRIVYVTPLLSHPVWLQAKEGLEEAAEDFGFDAQWIGPVNLDTDAMIQQIETAIVQQVDGIITMALNPEAMGPVLRKAAEAGIPVVTVVADAPDAPRLAYLGLDSKSFAYTGAETVLEKLGDKPVRMAAMVAALDSKTAREIVDYYKEVFEAAPNDFEFLTVAESRSDMFTAVQQWENIIQTYPEINVAVNVAAEAGSAAGKVASEKGIEDDLIVVAISDMEETLAGIRDGNIYMTLTENFYRMGYQPAQWLYEYATTGVKPKLINDTGTIPVTVDNIDSYIDELQDKSRW